MQELSDLSYCARMLLLGRRLILIVNVGAREDTVFEMLSRPAGEGTVAGLVNEKCDRMISRYTFDEVSEDKVCRVQVGVGSIGVRKVVSKKFWKDVDTETLVL